MINFHLHYNNTSTVFSLFEDQTMLELKANIMNIIDIELNDFTVILAGFGYIEESLDLSIACFNFGLNFIKNRSNYIL